ncbi:MAG: TRAP transporter small permease [Rhodospirillaceae bacterium]|nr:TRAP transporter small permease [Rhodospirillaceae bacterium]MDD9996166.1 TRAP transporter small permease [Rhodospirillaceae bacterium]MDE0363538.1 TRAP transporter small permease [Rhodospirillaceae bacterium]
MSIIKLSDSLTRALLVLAALWAFVLTFFIIADIVGRSVFNSPVYGVPEIVMNSIVMIVFLQAGYAIRSGAMLRADFLAQRFPPLFGRVALAVGYLLGAAFFAMILFGGWEAAIRSWVAGEYEGEGALRVPAWPTRWTILVGSALACFNYLLMAYLDIFRPEALRASQRMEALSASTEPEAPITPAEPGTPTSPTERATSDTNGAKP